MPSCVETEKREPTESAPRTLRLAANAREIEGGLCDLCIILCVQCNTDNCFIKAVASGNIVRYECAGYPQATKQ